MTQDERDDWLACARTSWPRLDIPLRVYLAAADRVVAEEHDGVSDS